MKNLRRLNLILMAVAVLVLFLMLKGIDWGSLAGYFLHRKRNWPLLLLPYGVTCYLWTVSWGVLLVGRRESISMTRLFFIRLAGEALNQLTPAASLGGEPYKALRLKECGIPWQEATASLAIHKVLTVLSLVLYIFIALAVIPFAIPDLPWRLEGISVLGACLLAAGGVAFAYLQRRNPCATLIRFLQRIGLCPAILLEKEGELTLLDAQLSSFYRVHARRGYLSLLFLFLGWVAHAIEVYVIFLFLGRPIGMEGALCFDALSQVCAAVGFMIPASFGVQDAGNVLLSLGFQYGATLGAGFGIVRRFREAFWLLVGLAASRWA